MAQEGRRETALSHRPRTIEIKPYALMDRELQYLKRNYKHRLFD